MKYKVGDKAKIREDLEIGKTYNGQTFVTQMEKYKGQIVTIKIVDNGGHYIEEDGQDWYWTEDMLEDLEKKTIGEIIDNLMKNPALVIKELSKAVEDCKKVNEDLKTKLKYKQSEIDFLKGQLSIYEKFLKDEEV